VGGYVTVPVLAAARSLAIPTLIHESNARPGLANRLLNRFATRTAVGLAAANSELTRPGVVTGTPARPEFFKVPLFDAGRGTRRVLVFGGSQGAAVLNTAFAAAAPALSALDAEVIHQTGEAHHDETLRRYRTVPPKWRIVRFLPRLWEEIAWADLVVSRAGALTLAELAAAGRAALLVPFGSATQGHQLANARAAERAGAACVLEESQTTPEALTGAIARLLSDPRRLAQMAACARALAAPDAARRLADLLFEAEQ
jgi:UDP-N-acetylglucosamine--N-acetylmuramyl-(pentapeptide) pyrophosphoryl-undecaprenol N-acetylglucosamine transferase